MAETVDCEVAYARPDRQFVMRVNLPAGATAREALRRALESGLAATCPEINPDTAVLGIYGQTVSPDHVLNPGDRVEIYRPLAMDPREARRERVQSTKKGQKQQRS